MKFLTKPMAAILGPDEQLLGGCKSAGMNAVMKYAAGGVVGAAIPGSGGSGGFASAVPQEKVFWIAATNLRLVYFGVGMMTASPKSVRGETPLGAVAGIQVTRQKLSRRMAISFTDGSQTAVDLYRASSPDSLQQAMEQMLPGRVVETA